MWVSHSFFLSFFFQLFFYGPFTLTFYTNISLYRRHRQEHNTLKADRLVRAESEVPAVTAGVSSGSTAGDESVGS